MKRRMSLTQKTRAFGSTFAHSMGIIPDSIHSELPDQIIDNPDDTVTLKMIGGREADMMKPPVSDQPSCYVACDGPCCYDTKWNKFKEEIFIYLVGDSSGKTVLAKPGINFDPRSVQIIHPPGLGKIESINPVNGEIVYTYELTETRRDYFGYSVVRNDGIITCFNVNMLNCAPYINWDVQNPAAQGFNVRGGINTRFNILKSIDPPLITSSDNSICEITVQGFSITSVSGSGSESDPYVTNEGSKIIITSFHEFLYIPTTTPSVTPLTEIFDFTMCIGDPETPSNYTARIQINTVYFPLGFGPELLIDCNIGTFANNDTATVGINTITLLSFLLNDFIGEDATVNVTSIIPLTGTVSGAGTSSDPYVLSESGALIVAGYEHSGSISYSAQGEPGTDVFDINYTIDGGVNNGLTVTTTFTITIEA